MDVRMEIRLSDETRAQLAAASRAVREFVRAMKRIARNLGRRLSRPETKAAIERCVRYMEARNEWQRSRVEAAAAFGLKRHGIDFDGPSGQPTGI